MTCDGSGQTIVYVLPDSRKSTVKMRSNYRIGAAQERHEWCVVVAQYGDNISYVLSYILDL